MSKEVDERVVSMQFDNRHFERNVQTTMSTLDKLKQKLHLPGAAKGIEEIGAASKKLDFSPMSKGLETVKVQFSAMQIAGITAITNLTNSAVNAGKRIASALTIDPVKTGFNEYELKMDSVKTIMASTGEPIERVNELLEELNEYSDQTIYSFADMTQNIGKFTNAGVKLDDAVLAIKGISNEAALSGANANEASRAMYNFAQALSVGYIQRIDWKSIELANMATQGFKEQLLNAAIAAGTVQKKADGMYATLAHPEKAYNAAAMFTETLDDQWLTTEVLISTLKDYADETTDIGKKAFAAAQDVTKLSQMFDILKETAQSGWAKTWEIIFGDLNQAKALFTPLTEFFSKIVAGMNDVRNAILEGALGKTFKSLLEPIKGIKKTVDTITEPIDKITKSLEEYNAVVKEVIRGDWGVTQKRWNALAEAGYDWATVQNMVNEELGCSVRHATDFSIGQAETAKSTEKLTETNNEYIASLTKMSDAELRALDLEEDQIAAIKQLKKEADKLGLSVEDFLANIDNLDGRWVVIQTFKNVGEALGKVFKTVAQAWKEIFPPKSIEERSNALYNIIAALHKFSLKLKMSDETADKLKRTLKGVFAIIDIITTITGGVFKTAIKVLCKVLGVLDVDILSVTASVGDAIVAFRDWLLNGNRITKCLIKIIEVGVTVAKVIKDWIKAFINLPIVQNGVKKLTDFLVKAFEVGKYTIAGLIKGLKDGTISVVDIMINIGKKIISTIEKILGIHSPSREFIRIGKYIIEGLVDGITNGFPLVLETMQKLAGHLLNFIKNVDIGSIIAGGIIAGTLVILNKFANAMVSIASAFEGIGDLAEGVGSFFENLGKGLKANLKANALEKKSRALLNLAIAIGIMAASVYLLSKLKTGEIWGAIGAIAALAAIIGVLALAASKIDAVGGGFGKSSVAIIAISASLLIMAMAIKKLAGIDEGSGKAVALFTGILIGLAVIFKLIGKLVSGKGAGEIDKAGKLILKMSVAMLLMAFVIKSAGKIDGKTVTNAISVLGTVMVLFAAVITASLLAGKYADKAGSMLLKMSIAMGIMIAVVKFAAGVNRSELDKALSTISVIGVIFAGLVAVSLVAGQHASKAGSMIMKISVAMMLMAASFKVFGTMSESDLGKALTAVTTIGLIFTAFIMLSQMSGEHASKAGSMILKMSAALLLMVGAIAILGLMKPEDVSRGLATITVLTGCLAALIYITKYAKASKNVTQTLTKFIVAIGLLVVAVVALSFLDPGKLAMATGAITLLVGVFAGLIAATKLMSSSKDVQKTLLLMVGIVAILGGVLVALTMLNPEGALQVSVALSTLMTSFTASLVLIGKTKTISNNALIAVGVMVAVMAALGIILYALRDLPVDSTLANAAALSTMLVSMSSACLILAAVGKMGTGVFVGLAALGALIVGLGVILVALGALMNTISGLESALDKGIEILGKIGYALGSFIGNIIGGLAEGIMSSLPKIGEHLSKFMDNLDGFIKGAKSIDGATTKGIKNLAEAILILTATTIIDGIASFFGGGTSSIDKFGKQIVKFGKSMVDFSTIVAGNIDEGAVTAAANAGKCLTEMVQTIPKTGGVIQFFTGEHDFDKFSKQIVPFGEAMTAFSEKVAGNIDEGAVTAAANAGKTLTEMVKTIPKSGGLIQMFTGEHDWKKFNEQIVPFGEAIAGFSEKVSGKIDSTSVEAAAKGGSMLAAMAQNIPTAGGLKEIIMGYTDWTGFNEGITDFAEAISSMSTKLSEGNFDDSKVIAASKAGLFLGAMADNLPQAGGLKQLITGYTDWTTFNTEIVNFSKSIVGMSQELSKGEFDSAKVESAAKAGEALGAMAKSIPPKEDLADIFWSDQADWDSFNNGIVSFAKALKSFYSVLAPAVQETEGTANKYNNLKFGPSLAETFKPVAELDMDMIKKACEAGKALGEMAAAIPTEEDLFDFFSSDQANWDSFTKGVGEFAKALKKFATEIDGVETDGCEAAMDTIRSLIDMLNDLYSDMDTSPIFYGEEIYLDGLQANVGKLGAIVTEFFNNFRHIDIDALTAKAEAAKTLFSAIASLPSWVTNGTSTSLETLGKQIVSFAESLTKFGDEMANVDLNSATGVITQFKTIVGDMMNAGLTSVEEKIKPYTTSGETLLGAFIKGCENKKDSLKQAMTNFTSAGMKAINNTTEYNKWYAVGEYLVTGFSNGITNNTFRAEAAATAMAEAAIASARSVLKINSPSKVFYSIGSGVIEGFVGAVDDGERTVYGSGSNLAQSVRNGFTSALSKVQDVLNNGIDARPTIRPVLDLSDVESGVGSINGMFDGSPSIGLMSNIRAISSGMNSRQNGGNDDVVSAIKDLKGTLSKLSGNSYSVNGISYNDESVVSNAIETLVQATRIDRRR